MNIRSQQKKFYLTLIFVCLCGLSAFTSFAAQPEDTKTGETTETWAITATTFKLAGEKEARNVKLNWMQREDVDLYKVYRDGEFIGEAKGNT